MQPTKRLRYDQIHEDDVSSSALHSAVVNNDVDSIKNLLHAGHDVNAKNSSGDTALLVASKLHRLPIAKILLDADADVMSAVDALSGETALGILISRGKEAAEYSAPWFVNNLNRRRDLDAATLADFFVASDCHVEYFLSMKNPRVIPEFIKRKPCLDYRYEMGLAMGKFDFEGIRTILRHDDMSWRLAFYHNLDHFRATKRIELWRIFIESLPHWDVVGETHLVHLASLSLMYQEYSLEYVRILLASGIHVQVREKFGMDLRTALFGNGSVDAIELTRYTDFDVNAPGNRQQSALHFAVQRDFVENARFLLDSGANVDSTNDEGRVALFDCIKNKSGGCLALLLQNGADVQAIAKFRATIFRYAVIYRLALFDFLLAQLAIDPARGVPIKQEVQHELEKRIAPDLRVNCKKIYERYSRQLQVLKTSPITKDISLFTILTEKIETLSRSLCDKDKVISLLDELQSQCRLCLHYRSTIMLKLTKAWDLHYFRCHLADVISESTGQFVGFDHLVVQKISVYLTRRDVDEFCKVYKIVDQNYRTS